MSIQSIKSLVSSAPATAMDAKASQSSKPFVRNAMAGKTTNVAPASAKDSGPMEQWRYEVFQACEKLGLKPGHEKIITIDGKPMVLRRTATADAYVLQTVEESVHERFNGLHLKNNLEMRYNMELAGYDCANKEAMQQFLKLGKALGVPHGGSGYDVGFSVLSR